MNDRIKELMVRAGFDVEKLQMYPGGWPREDLLILEDFAKLIVQECAAEIIKQNDGEEPVDSWERGYVAGINCALRSIKEHFGVK